MQIRLSARWATRLASDNTRAEEHDVVRSTWARQHCELYCMGKLDRGMPISCEISRADRCLFGLSSWPSTRSSTAPPWTRSAAAWLKGNCTRRVDSFQQTIDASKVPTLVGKFTKQPSCNTSRQTEILKIRIASSWILFTILFNVYWYWGLDSFPR